MAFYLVFFYIQNNDFVVVAYKGVFRACTL